MVWQTFKVFEKLGFFFKSSILIAMATKFAFSLEAASIRESGNGVGVSGFISSISDPLLFKSLKIKYIKSKNKHMGDK
jgi:hypothetical protein